MEDMSAEEWRIIPGFEKYSVSNMGRVRRDKCGSGTRPGRIMKPHLNKDGRLVVTLYRDGGRQLLNVHRLVMAAFVGPCPPGRQVAHDNGNRDDNRLCNLVYKTASENALDKHRHGRNASSIQVLTIHQVIAIMDRLDAGEFITILAREYGVSAAAISDIKHGRTWAHLRPGGVPHRSAPPAPRSEALRVIDSTAARDAASRGIEQWLPVPGFEKYSVSNMGRVRRDKGGYGARAGKILKPQADKKGRSTVSLYRDGSQQTLRVHRLVMVAFEGDRPDGMQVAHCNGQIDDNRLCNLMYKTVSENALDKHRHGVIASPLQALTPIKAAEIMARLDAGEGGAILARDFGVDRTTISHIKTGRTWAHLRTQSKDAA